MHAALKLVIALLVLTVVAIIIYLLVDGSGEGFRGHGGRGGHGRWGGRGHRFPMWRRGPRYPYPLYTRTWPALADYPEWWGGNDYLINLVSQKCANAADPTWTTQDWRRCMLANMPNY